MSDPRDSEPGELSDLLSELESTLATLRDELAPGRRGTGGRRPRPPRFRDVLRFTESYTIPALIAILEANIRLLELFRGLLRTLDPERSATEDTDGTSRAGARSPSREFEEVADATGRATADRLADGLGVLQDALRETDLSGNPEVDRLVSEARDLSAEVQRRLEEGRSQADLTRYASSAEGGAGEEDDEWGVRIEVTEADDTDDHGSNRTDATAADDEGPVEIDVDAELDSIKDEVEVDEAFREREEGDGGSGDGSEAGSGDGSDAGDADDSDDGPDSGGDDGPDSGGDDEPDAASDDDPDAISDDPNPTSDDDST